MSRVLRIAAQVAVLVGMSAQTAFAAALTLTGAQEVPPVITSGNGSGELLVSMDGNVSGSITTHGVVGTMVHIHRGAVGINGPAIITLTRGAGNVWTVPTQTRLTPYQLMTFRDGGLYVNVHTNTNKGGEIRAQLAY